MEELIFAVRITILPLIQDALAAGKTLPEIRTISELAAQHAADRLDAFRNQNSPCVCPHAE